MQYSTYLFILAALPLTVCGYYLFARLGRKAANLFLAGASLCLYAYGGWKSLLWLCVSIGVNSLLLAGMKRWKKGTKALLWLGIAFHVGLLFVFKYLNFAAQTVNLVLRTAIYPPSLALPLGISFFTFQQIAYLVDASRGEREGDSFLDYVLYVVYFPKLIMGPIAPAEDLIPQFHQESRLRFRQESFCAGMRQFTFGLFKKAVLADTFASAAVFLTMEEASALELILMMLAYTFQIYFDFSGYSDMALGFSRMLNIDLPMNFDSPYKALSIRDFWKRWHMSLTAFLTRYIYFPLGGSRKGKARTYLNTIIVFLISGLWHGASFGFVLWGLLNGLLSVFERMTEQYRKYIPKALQWLLTFVVINVLWLLFQNGSTTEWIGRLTKILAFADTNICSGFYERFLTPEIQLLLRLLRLDMGLLWVRRAVLGLFYGGSLLLCLVPENTCRREYGMTARSAILTALLLVFCLTCLSKNAVFVYNQF